MKSVLSLLSLVFFLLQPPMASAENADKENCNTENFNSCAVLSYLYAEGYVPFPKDEARASKLEASFLKALKEACAQGPIANCTQYFARPFIWLKYSEADRLEAAVEYKALLEKRCAENEPKACSKRAILWLERIGSRYSPYLKQVLSPEDIPSDPEADAAYWDEQAKRAATAALKSLKNACDAGHDLSCIDYHETRAIYSDDTDEEAASQMAIITYCANGNAHACSRISWLSRLPRKGAVREEMMGHLSNGCNAGVGPSCMAYLGELPFREREERTTPLLEKACAFDHAEACEEIATAAYRAYGKSQDPDTLLRATEFFTKACDLGEIISCHYLEHLSKG